MARSLLERWVSERRHSQLKNATLINNQQAAGCDDDHLSELCDDLTLQVDCTIHGRLCHQHGVRAYPTTVFFNNSRCDDDYDDNGDDDDDDDDGGDGDGDCDCDGDGDGGPAKVRQKEIGRPRVKPMLTALWFSLSLK